MIEQRKVGAQKIGETLAQIVLAWESISRMRMSYREKGGEDKRDHEGQVQDKDAGKGFTMQN